MTEHEELEEYNREFNAKANARELVIPTTKRYDACLGWGKRYISPICDYEGIDRRCQICMGKGVLPI